MTENIHETFILNTISRLSVCLQFRNGVHGVKAISHSEYVFFFMSTR